MIETFPRYVVKNVREDSWIGKDSMDSRVPRVFTQRNHAATAVTTACESWKWKSYQYTRDDFKITPARLVVVEDEA